MNSSEVRQTFLSYFKNRGHECVASSPLIPGNDPTLLFTNAGMVQFKETFLGGEKRGYSRAVTSQRCVRAGGKHNDLDNVGYTARHHTFFEMLGNFSFGDYFKRDAIQFAWDFLTKELKLPEERLWVTVYAGDDEAAGIWLNELKVSEQRFSRCGEKDNFWSMGDTGPCGPCTEIFYDHGPSIEGGPPGTPEEDGDRYVEIWNLVFMQFNRDRDGQLTPLPNPSIDTGMGLERISAVMQGVHSNYDIDLFQYLIHATHRFTPHTDIQSASLKVIADHIRACAFLIIDGVIPSNEGRGYVLRRIIRRAIRHGNKLGIHDSFFYQLVKPLAQIMGDAYPELVRLTPIIERIIKQEEEQFARTIEHGLKLLTQYISELEGKIIDGNLAFKLYDTYGFPVDLTADIAREQGLTVDMPGFDKAMETQRTQSKAGSHFKDHEITSGVIEEISDFCGYEAQKSKGLITGLLIGEDRAEQVMMGQQVSIVLNKTPFYAESGGQVGDIGQLVSPEGRFKVLDTQKSAQAILHFGKVTEGHLKIGDEVCTEIDEARRQAIALNHSATHLLHAALKTIIGKHVVQKGSLVESQKARFDFSHFEAITQSQLNEVEELVNEKIRQNFAVKTELMTPEEARKSGAVALFGEKYGESVRVLTMGNFSKELCGGTHVERTGDIGLFKITAEFGIAAGIRRIEMVTGEYALKRVNEQLLLLEQAAQCLKTEKNKLIDKLSHFLLDFKQIDKENRQLKAKLNHQASGDLLTKIKQIGEVDLLVAQLDGINNNELRAKLDSLKSKLDSAVIVLTAVNGEKMSVVAGVSKSLLGKVPSARVYVRHLCGKGGGRDDMAQGGGEVPADLKQRLEGVPLLLKAHQSE